jgi:hypothetical protein
MENIKFFFQTQKQKTYEYFLVAFNGFVNSKAALLSYSSRFMCMSERLNNSVYSAGVSDMFYTLPPPALRHVHTPVNQTLLDTEALCMRVLVYA